jgi:hypothetical protein
MSEHDAHAGRHDAEDAHAPIDTTGAHGMLLFGDDPLYLSHLPMFHHPHNFQVLLTVQLDEDSATALRSDQAAGGSDLYTFLPDSFPLAELDPRKKSGRSTVAGTVFRGHFERGGTPIAGGAVADVIRVLHFDVLDDRAQAANAALSYFCFGFADRLHLAHAITARPSFDHVLAARVLPRSLTDMSGRPLEDDVTAVSFVHAPLAGFDRSDAPDTRLMPGETVRGTFRSTPSPSGMHGFSAQIEIREELYLETAELA